MALAQGFVVTANQMNVDLSICGGDLVIFVDGKTRALWHLQNITKCFNDLAAPLLLNRGNHEDYLWPLPDIQKSLGIPSESYVHEKNGFTIVMWNPSVRIGKDGLCMHPSDLEWLEKALSDAALPCIVSTHVPLDNDAYDDQHVQKHDGKPFCSFYREGPEARRIMKESGKVIACLAGHRHRNRHRVFDDIHFITRQSLVQADRPEDPPYGAFSIIDIGEDSIEVKGFGRDQPSLMLRYATPPAFRREKQPRLELEMA